MTASVTLLAVVGVLYATGVYVMLERSLTRVLIGFLLVGNATNLLVFVMSSTPGVAPIVDDGVDPATFADPVPQVFILTAIVINFGITAFLLALVYRSWWLARLGERGDDIVDGAAIEHLEQVLPSVRDGDAIEDALDVSDEENDPAEAARAEERS